MSTRSTDSIRRLMLECPRALRECVLTDNQLEQYKRIHDAETGGMTATEYANAYATSPQVASLALNKLYLSGYLDKRARIRKIGGKEYVYTARSFAFTRTVSSL